MNLFGKKQKKTETPATSPRDSDDAIIKPSRIRRGCGCVTEHFFGSTVTQADIDYLEATPCNACQEEAKRRQAKEDFAYRQETAPIGNCIRCGNSLHRGETCGCLDFDE